MEKEKNTKKTTSAKETSVKKDGKTVSMKKEGVQKRTSTVDAKKGTAQVKKNTTRKEAVKVEPVTKVEEAEEIVDVQPVVFKEKKTQSTKSWKTIEWKRVLLILLGIVVFIVACFVLSEVAVDHSNDKKLVYQDPSNPLLAEGQVLDEEKMKDYETIGFDTFLSYLKEKKTALVFVGSEGCGWCTYQKPLLKAVAYDYDLDVKYLDISTLTSEQRDQFNELHDDLKEDYGTPMFFAVRDGKVDQISHGANSTEQLIETFKDQGFIES